MRLQDNIFYFNIPSEIKGMKLLESNIVINDKKLDKKLESLFKGEPKQKGNNSIKGFSILEFVNEKNEIEIDSIVYSISFLNTDVSFTLNKVKPCQIQRSPKKLSDEELTNLGKLITEITPNKDSQVVAAAKVNPSSSDGLPKDEVGVVFNPDNYNEDKNELIAEGYKEYVNKEKGNYSILCKGEKVILVELNKDDYDVLNEEDFDIELDDKTHTFTINKIV